jgi:dTDP-4-amino-4,6-dideoxygalactose transaminase
MYYVLLPDLVARGEFITGMKAAGVGTVFHYVPLHSSPGGQRFGRAHGALSLTDELSDRLVRLPLWLGMEDRLDEVFDAADAMLARRAVAVD